MRLAAFTTGIALGLALIYATLTQNGLAAANQMALLENQTAANRLLNQATVNQTKLNALVNQASATLKDFKDSWDDNYDTNKANIESTATLLRSSVEYVDALKVASFGKQGDGGLAQDAHKVLAASTETVKSGKEAITATQAPIKALGDSLVQFDALLGSIRKLEPSLQASADNFAKASGELVPAIQHFGGATAEGEEAIGYVRDYLKPTKVPFWKAVLGMLIPKPTFAVKR